jgi:hypothetical protein
LEIAPPFVIQFVDGRLASSLDENAGATSDLLLPPQPAARMTRATSSAAVAVVARRFTW